MMSVILKSYTFLLYCHIVKAEGYLRTIRNFQNRKYCWLCMYIKPKQSTLHFYAYLGSFHFKQERRKLTDQTQRSINQQKKKYHKPLILWKPGNIL